MYSRRAQPGVVFGYTNASWTLKCDLTCEYVCRLLNYMDRHGYRQCVPRNDRSLPSPNCRGWIFPPAMCSARSHILPKQGTKRPWRLYQNYALDLVTLRFGKVDDGVMRYS